MGNWSLLCLFCILSWIAVFMGDAIEINNDSETRYESSYEILELEVTKQQYSELITTNSAELWNIDIIHVQYTKDNTIKLQILKQTSTSKVTNDFEEKLLKDAKIIKSKQQLGEILESEFNRRKNRTGEASKTNSFYDEFRTYDEIMTYCDSLAAENANLVTKVQIGETYEGAIIYGYYISTSTYFPDSKPVIYLEALQHAREWLAPPTLVYAFDTLLSGYATGNQTLINLIEQMNWYIVPVVNIDGYKYTWSDSEPDARLWRKNRHQFEVYVGVDLNRNWGPADTWCTSGSSTFQGSETYCGEYVFSEPESRSVAEFMDQIPNLVGGIDYHTYGSLLLWPWQYTYDHIPSDNYTTISLLGTAMVDAINLVHGRNFVSEQGSDLYPHSGGFIDYNFEKNNVIAFTLELRGEGFIVPPQDILPSGQEAFQGLVIFAQYLISHFHSGNN